MQMHPLFSCRRQSFSEMKWQMGSAHCHEEDKIVRMRAMYEKGTL
jgi:hypothetical protein